MAGRRVAACLVGVERRDVQRGDVLVRRPGAGTVVPRRRRAAGGAGGRRRAAAAHHVEALHGDDGRPRPRGAARRHAAGGRRDRPCAAAAGGSRLPPCAATGSSSAPWRRPRRSPAARCSTRARPATAATRRRSRASTRSPPRRRPTSRSRRWATRRARRRTSRHAACSTPARPTRRWPSSSARARSSSSAAGSSSPPSATGRWPEPCGRRWRPAPHRTRSSRRVPAAALLPEPAREALAARLERDGIAVRDGSGLRAPGAVAGSSAVAEAADALVDALGRTPFAPPRLEDALAGLALTPAEARALVGVLEREGRIVRLGDGLAVTREAYDAAVAYVREGCAAGGSYTLAELRDATGTSRRWAQALLERHGRRRHHPPRRRRPRAAALARLSGVSSRRRARRGATRARPRRRSPAPGGASPRRAPPRAGDRPAAPRRPARTAG